MDAPPLFGEESRKEKWFQYLAIGALTASTLAAFIMSITSGISQNGIHFGLGIGLLAFLALVLLLWRWYRAGDLDPKFKYFIAVFWLVQLVMVIVGFIYFSYKPTDYNALCPNGFWYQNITLPDTKAARCYSMCKPGFCLDTNVPAPGRCYNCTQTPPPKGSFAGEAVYVSPDQDFDTLLSDI
ncbi:hypothetical protein H696_05589 [Fonticula alba]|uniref:Uncharacterized protein n=1 Tax=Fonticula alba TaxID=691883 RepID=A0A058Z0R7_FONAL|nr:hypothetical protein H696_05589 [Fonticula alba]KCV67859.1 hypothetical protein H696_05589 [Fonticula alba]|eukprot:XP_009497679.1 hypothetical protein H696_05589 [Fonticula alba]